VIGFNVVYHRFRAMYDSGCQICCNWSRLKPGYKVPAHRSTMTQIIMIPHPVTLNWHWVNQPCSRPLMVNSNQGKSRCQFFSLWLEPTGESNLRSSTLGASVFIKTILNTIMLLIQWMTHLLWCFDFIQSRSKMLYILIANIFFCVGKIWMKFDEK